MSDLTFSDRLTKLEAIVECLQNQTYSFSAGFKVLLAEVGVVVNFMSDQFKLDGDGLVDKVNQLLRQSLVDLNGMEELINSLSGLPDEPLVVTVGDTAVVKIEEDEVPTDSEARDGDEAMPVILTVRSIETNVFNCPAPEDHSGAFFEMGAESAESSATSFASSSPPPSPLPTLPMAKCQKKCTPITTRAGVKRSARIAAKQIHSFKHIYEKSQRCLMCCKIGTSTLSCNLVASRRKKLIGLVAGLKSHKVVEGERLPKNLGMARVYPTTSFSAAATTELQKTIPHFSSVLGRDSLGNIIKLTTDDVTKMANCYVNLGERVDAGKSWV